MCPDRDERNGEQVCEGYYLLLAYSFCCRYVQRHKRPRGVEVFGGYSYFHAETGRDLHGWNGSVAANLNKWFGLVVDVSGHYDSSSSSIVVTIPDFPTLPGLPPIEFRTRVDTNIHTIMVGPRFSYRKIEKITPFAHALFGVSRTHTEAREPERFVRIFFFQQRNDIRYGDWRRVRCEVEQEPCLASHSGRLPVQAIGI